MCLSVIGKLEKINGNDAEVDIMGVKYDCRLDLLDDTVQLGDYVLLHTGYAINKLDKDEALSTLEDIKKIYSIET